MNAPEPIGRHADLVLVRWRDPALPAAVADLIGEAQATGVDWIADFPSAWAARPYLDAGEALFVALAGDRPAGMAVISADPHTDEAGVGRLRFIYVAQAFRGRGLLRIFIDLCLARGRSRWRRLRLHTDNPVAARVYESYGFVPVTEHRSTHAWTL